MDKPNKGCIHTIMGTLRKLMPADPSGENARPVRIFQRMLWLKDLLNGRQLSNWFQSDPWPVTSGSYLLGDQFASVAVCTLTSADLMEPMSKVPGVAIAGRLVTPNLGIEKVILNTISNPHIRFLLICGKESPVFHTAQSLVSLFRNGVDEEHRIISAEGHYPVLGNLSSDQIDRFRRQLELVDCTDDEDLPSLRQKISTLAERQKPPLKSQPDLLHRMTSKEQTFTQIRPGGPRGTPTYDPNGFFVITVDHEAKAILVRHYQPDNTPAHEMRGRRAESILRGLVREGLISQLSHAGYLGVELAKAETALRLGLNYEQDHPIKKRGD